MSREMWRLRPLFRNLLLSSTETSYQSPPNIDIKQTDDIDNKMGKFEQETCACLLCTDDICLPTLISSCCYNNQKQVGKKGTHFVLSFQVTFHCWRKPETQESYLQEGLLAISCTIAFNWELTYHQRSREGTWKMFLALLAYFLFYSEP